MDAATIVDEAAQSRVLVLGSVPPHGRDLDLFVDAAMQAELETALERAGYERFDDQWIRFADCTASAVDLVPWDEWGLPPDELSALLGDARPIESYASLVLPSPRHALLVLARKLARERTPLGERHRRRIDEQLRIDPDAWTAAAQSASRWRLDAELARLRRRYERGGGVPLHRPRAGAVVALSGLDGSGKSSQARALASALERLGYESETVWVPLGSSRVLQGVARGGKQLLAGARGRNTRAAADERLLWNPGGRQEERGALVAAAAAVWSTAGTIANAGAHLGAAAAPLATGRVVIFDRYVLDTIVHLRFTYGGVAHPVQERLIRLLSPTPIASFFLDVPAEEAHRRKQDWDLDVLERQAALYRQEHARLGVRRLDGARPPADLAAEIAREVWTSLRRDP